MQYNVTIVYVFNQLEKRRLFWKQMENPGANIKTSWILIGDRNNVLTRKDIVGGYNVTEAEYRDIAKVMQNIGLYEATTRRCRYTWTNKLTTGVIYCDHVIGNIDWFQEYHDIIVEVLVPNIFYHASLRVRERNQQNKRRSMFKFLNCI